MHNIKKMIILIVILYILYNYYKPDIVKNIIFKIFDRFEHSNFKLIDVKNNNDVIYSKIDISTKCVNIYINNVNKFFLSLWDNGELGLGESYVSGYWDTDDLLDFLTILLLNRNNKYIPNFNLYNFYNKSIEYDKSNISFHYDVGNDFYNTFLTDTLSAYTCGFFLDNNTTLEQAQYNKVNTIIKKMNALPNKTILDIGCGWVVTSIYKS